MQPAWTSRRCRACLRAARSPRRRPRSPRVQQPDGGIPWAVGEHIDVWNHVEAAMALLVGGEVAAAEAAYDWCLATQRADGSWPMKIVAATSRTPAATRTCRAYLAVGDLAPLAAAPGRRVRTPAAGRRSAAGSTSWRGCSCRSAASPGRSRATARSTRRRCWPAARASTTRCGRGFALAELVGEPQPDWELAAGRLGHALREHRDLFLDKSDVLDGLVLPGARRRRCAASAAPTLLDGAWDDFVVDGLGCRCVDNNPWVTGAETCELVMALDALGDRGPRAEGCSATCSTRGTSAVVLDRLRLRRRGVFWPHEQTTYTSAAVILAADALVPDDARLRHLPRRRLLAPHAAIGLRCGCALGRSDGVAGRRRRTSSTRMEPQRLTSSNPSSSARR